jgi:hypothetical protein
MTTTIISLGQHRHNDVQPKISDATSSNDDFIIVHAPTARRTSCGTVRGLSPEERREEEGVPSLCWACRWSRSS